MSSTGGFATCSSQLPRLHLRNNLVVVWRNAFGQCKCVCSDHVGTHNVDQRWLLCANRVHEACSAATRQRFHALCEFLFLMSGDLGTNTGSRTPNSAVVAQHSQHARLASFLNAVTFNTTLTRDIWWYLDSAFDLDAFVMSSKLDKLLEVCNYFVSRLGVYCV